MTDTGNVGKTVRRVVILNDTVVARGGATALALMSAELLRARDIEVTYICGDAGDNAALRELGVEILPLAGRELLQQSRLASVVKGINNRAACDLVAGFIATRDTPETVYHVHNWGQILSPGIFAPLRQVSSRVIVHSHDFFLACPNGVFFDFRKEQDCDRKPLGRACSITNCDKRSFAHKGWRLARHHWFRHVFDQAMPWAAIVLIHEGMTRQMLLADYPASRLVTMRNPAPRFSPARVKAEENQGFVFVGRVEPDKGVIPLIAAAGQAGVDLTVIGDGPLRASLSQQHPNVSFPGWKSRSEIGALVQKARALVMPSRFREPFGLVAVEASQSGLPVILPHSALLADEVVANGLGLACNIRDIDAFAATLGQMRDMPAADIRAISERGFAAQKPLGQSPESWADALVGLYEQAIGGEG